MMSPFSDQGISVVIAHQGTGRHLLDSFLDLKLCFSDITIVGNDCPSMQEKIKSHGGTWIENDSFDNSNLWERGMQSKDSSWFLLVDSREYLSAILKESIVKSFKLSFDQTSWFPIKREIFLLNQRLKYPLEWAEDSRSGLLFVGNDNLKLINKSFIFERNTLIGKSIFFGENNISEVILNTLRRADIAADKLYQEDPNLSSFSLFYRTLTTIPSSFFKNLFIKKGIREGFVGLVFSVLDSSMRFLSYLRYYEKYIRSGKRIEDNLNSVKKILVIKLRGLGDAVLATPVIKNINKLMPDVSISVLTFNFCVPLFDNNPHLEKVYGLSGKPARAELSQLLRMLNKEKFDLILNLHARNFSTKFAKKIRARWKVSKSYFIRDKHSEISIGSDHSLDKSSVERDLDCLRAIGLEPQEKTSEIFVSNNEMQWAENFLRKQKIDISKKLILIHPTTNNSYTDWGLDRFISLATQLINNHSCQVMACFPEKEQAISKLLLEKINGIFVHVGSLRQSIALISKADLMIDNCSAPSHISVALNIPTIVLMGADYSNIYRDKEIYNGRAFLFYKNVPCRDLFWSRCLPPDPCQNRVCLDHSVEDVLNKTLEVLSIEHN